MDIITGVFSSLLFFTKSTINTKIEYPIMNIHRQRPTIPPLTNIEKKMLCGV